MATKVKKNYITYDRFINGIGDYEKKEVSDTIRFARCIDLRSSPRSFKLMPKTQKESGSVVVDLPKWADMVDSDVYMLGDTGHLYKRDSSFEYSDLRQIPSNHGNGMAYYGEDGYLHYASDRVLGRYGPLNIDGATPTFVDDFLGSEGGEPTNTHSTDLEASSSMYFTRADNADLSITGDISMEAYIKSESLPTSGGEMVIMGKWNEASDQRSYKFSIKTSSSNFGDGSAGNLTISSNTTQAPTDAACSGTINTYSLSATNASFAAGQEILIVQMIGTNAGISQRTKIQAYTAGTITTVDKLKISFSSSGTNKAQVLVLPQYADVTVNAGKTWTGKAWNGTTGGIFAFLASGTVTINGTITVSGKGFRGASRPASTVNIGGLQGEGYGTTVYDSTNYVANYSGGGGGRGSSGGSAGSSGGGGGYATIGGTGSTGSNPLGAGQPGNAVGGQDLLALMYMGGGGGSGGNSYSVGAGEGGGSGGAGGGIIYIAGATFTVNSGASITANGAQGLVADLGHANGGGGGGAGGSVLIETQTGTLGTALLTSSGGAGGYNTSGFAIQGGTGSVGRVHINYSTALTGTSSPTLYSTVDNDLSTITGYTLNLSISSTGANSEILTRPFSIAETGVWHRVAVTWVASTKIATFYVDGESVGSTTGALGAIYDSTALFSIGASFSGAGAAEKFFDGKMDDARLWNIARDADDLLFDKDLELGGNEVGLVVYFEFDNDATDSGPDGYDLTAVNSPTYSTDVPFSAPTAREDLDQSLDTTGDTYTLETSIDESSSAKRQDFVPEKDPQKSIEVNIAATGTGDWTLVVHDALNRVVVSKTVANASLHTGDFEFIFSDVWRPILGATYHFHITSTVADGTVVSTTNNNLNTADFHTYYQFLVTDTEWHPQIQFLNMLVTGNGRYLAVWDASSYDPHRLTFPSGYRVRALALWQGYLAIGVMRGDNIYDSEDGRVFLWDGYSKTYELSINLPEGGVNALFTSKGTLYIIPGYSGELMEYKGGSDASFVKQIPKLEKDKYIEIYPGALNMWHKLLYIGVAGGGDSDDVQRGVYAWGTKNIRYENSLTFDYIPSSLNYGSDVKIGLVYPVGNKLLIGVKDGGQYYVDYVDPGADPFSSGTVEFFIEDYGAVWKEKDAQTVRADFVALNDGESVAVKYKLDREDDWNEMDSAQSTEGKQKARLSILGGRHKEIEMACDLATTTTTSPEVLSVALEHSPLSDEEQF